MTRFHSTGQNNWQTRPYTDASLRLHVHGPIHPMQDERSFWSRLFNRGF